MSAYSLNFQEDGGAVPSSVGLAAGQSIRPASVVARWDGSGASGDFLACLSIYSPSGVLVSRTAPPVTFSPGDTGVVTYAPFLGREPEATPPVAGFVPYWRQTDTGGGNFATTLSIVPFSGPPRVDLITLTNLNVVTPKAAPDFSLVVYVARLNAFATPNTRTIAPDGSGDTLFLANASEPAWAPTSDELAVLLGGTGLVRRTLAGSQVNLTNAISPRWAVYTYDGARIAYWRQDTADVYAIDPGNTNNDLLDTEPGSFLSGSRLSPAHSSRMIAYGEATANEDYWRILTDGTGKTLCSDPLINYGNALVAPSVWSADDTRFVGHGIGGATWSEIIVFYADGVTPQVPLGLFYPNAGNGRPQVFGDRIYFIENAGAAIAGKPLVSVALDGSDHRVEDDCNGGDTAWTLGLE